MQPVIKHVFGIQTMSYLIYCLVLEDVLFTQAIQKNFDFGLQLGNLVSLMLHELVVFLGCHSQFVSYYRHLHRILTVAKFYNHTFWLWYGYRPMWYLSFMGASLTKTVINTSHR